MVIKQIQLYAGEPAKDIKTFHKQYYIELALQLESKLFTATGGTTIPSGGLLEAKIQKIEKDRDTARQNEALLQAENLKLRSSGAKGTLAPTEELIDWGKIHGDFTVSPHLVNKWRKTGSNAFVAEDYISRQLKSEDFCFVKWLREVKKKTLNDWEKSDNTARTALVNEYKALPLVDAYGFNWEDIPTKTPKAFTNDVKNNWENIAGFNFGETWQWIESGFTEADYGFCIWLRDVKGAMNASYRDPEWIMKKGNMGNLHAEYNAYIVINKHGLFKFKFTATASDDTPATRSITFTINAGSIKKEGMSVVQLARLNALTGFNTATYLRILYNTTHATTPPNPDLEKNAYDIVKPVFTDAKKVGKELTISIIDADRITVNGNSIEISYGTFDNLDIIGHSFKPLPAELVNKKAGLKTGIKFRLNRWGLDGVAFDANAKVHKSWDDVSVPDRPKWEAYLDQVIYDEPKATVAVDKTDFNLSTVEEVIWGALANFVIDFFALKGNQAGRTAVGTDKDNLQRYIDACRSQLELNIYNARVSDIESIGATTKQKVDNWGKVLLEIRNYLATTRSLKDIRDKGEELKNTYVNPMDGIVLDGKTKAEKQANITNGTLRKTVGTVAIINGASDFDKTYTTPTPLIVHYKSQKQRWLDYYTPVDTLGGGNCWLHSLNIHLTGLNDGSLITRLRVAACLELMTNKNWIADPLIANVANENIVAGEITRYLINRKVGGQFCRMAYEGDWFEGADGNFFSQLLSRPLILTYTSNGDAPYATGHYFMAHSRYDDKDLSTKFTHAEPWHIFNRNSGHYEAFIQHEDHREIVLRGKTKDVKIEDPTNSATPGKRSVIFEYTATHLKETEMSTDATIAGEITALNIKDVEKLTFDFSVDDDFTKQEYDRMVKMITDGVNLATITRKTDNWAITIYDYKKIDTADGLKIVPGEFEVEFLK